MLRSVITTVLEILAAVLIVAGAALIYAPAGFIVAGLLLGVASWRLTITDVGTEPPT